LPKPLTAYSALSSPRPIHAADGYCTRDSTVVASHCYGYTTITKCPQATTKAD